MKGLVVVLVLLLVGCSAEVPEPPPAATPLLETTGTIEVEAPMEFTKERVTFTAADSTQLVGTYYAAEGEKSLLLVHQFNKDRSSWDAFASEVQRNGFAVLAFDLRGHGESAGTHSSFTDADFIAMLQDVEAGATFLRNKEKRLTALLGASIGANTVYKYSSQHRIPAVLLSPGLNYKGIDINDITSSAPTLIIVSKDDTYAYQSSQELNENNLFGEHELYEIAGSAHGTDMLSSAAAKIGSFVASIE